VPCCHRLLATVAPLVVVVADLCGVDALFLPSSRCRSQSPSLGGSPMLTCRLAVLPSLARPRATSFVADPSGLSRFVVTFSSTSSTTVSLQRFGCQPPSLACRSSCLSNVHDSSPAAVCRPSPSRTRHVRSPKRPSIRSHRCHHVVAA